MSLLRASGSEVKAQVGASLAEPRQRQVGARSHAFPSLKELTASFSLPLAGSNPRLCNTAFPLPRKDAHCTFFFFFFLSFGGWERKTLIEIIKLAALPLHA